MASSVRAGGIFNQSGHTKRQMGSAESTQTRSQDEDKGSATRYVGGGTCAYFCIGSAGHAKGQSRASGTRSADDGPNSVLATKEDIDAAKTWFHNHPAFNKKGGFFGTYEVSGRCGSKEACLEALAQFFDDCGQTGLYPQIYYAGHGEEGTGNWCFPCGGLVSLQDVVNANTTGKNMWIYSDCCFSGKWVEAAERMNKVCVISSAAPDSFAYDNVFAPAKFGDVSSARRRLTELGAIRNRNPNAGSGIIDANEEV